jgi:hypothetical protein
MVAWQLMRSPSVVQVARIGTVLGALTFAILFIAWRIGSAHAARTAAETSLLLAAALVIGVVTLRRPAQMRKARVPVRRGAAPQWWPPEADTAPVVALCLGGPVLVACATGVVLFH